MAEGLCPLRHENFPNRPLLAGPLVPFLHSFLTQNLNIAQSVTKIKAKRKKELASTQDSFTYVSSYDVLDLPNACRSNHT